MSSTSRRAKPRSDFTRVRRLPDRAAYDQASVFAVLDEATFATVAHVIDGRPVATPTLHWRIGERVYWHGSVASRMLKRHADLGEVCLTAMIFDGWVLARSAFNHTVNYRSVMCFGRPEPVEGDAEKKRVLEAFMEHWFPQRWSQLRPVNRRELGATSIYSLALDEASAKIRDGGVGDPAKDLAWPVWAGVVPVAERLLPLQPDDGLAADVPAPRMPRLRKRGPVKSADA